LTSASSSRELRLTREERLYKQDDYRRVFQSKTRCWEDGFLVVALPSALDQARLGISAPRRYIAKAADRNRIKRIIRESFRHHKHQLIGWDVIASAGKGALFLTNKQIFDSLEKHWRKILQCKRF
jgi:ribonuclease P protein component